jgi:nitrogen fixation NifU-like protein
MPLKCAMSRNLDQLYQEVILEHNKAPRNFGAMVSPSVFRHGKNPLCGDDYYVYLKIEQGKIADVSFEGTGCAISKASGSMMTSIVKGKTVEEVRKLKDCFLGLVTDHPSDDCAACLGSLRVFEGVKKYPARVKCAALVWRALEAALEEKAAGEVSTENS